MGARQRGVAWEAAGCGAAIGAYEKSHHWEGALKLFGKMWQHRIEIGLVLCSTLINACVKGQQWHWSMYLMSDMRRSGIQGNVITNNALASSFEKGQLWQGSLEVLRLAPSTHV